MKKLEHVGEVKRGFWLCAESDAQTAWKYVTQVWETRSRSQDRNMPCILRSRVSTPPAQMDREENSEGYGMKTGDPSAEFHRKNRCGQGGWGIKPRRAERLGCPQRERKHSWGQRGRRCWDAMSGLY